MPMTNVTFARGALILMGAGLLALIAIIFTAAWLSARTADLAAVSLQARVERSLTAQVQEELLNAETGQRGYLLTSDIRYLAPFELARRQLPGDLAQIRSLSASGIATVQQADALMAVSRAKLAELSKTVSLAQGNRRDAAIAEVKTGRGLALMQQARLLLGELTATAEKRVTDNVNEMAADAALLRLVTLLGGGLILIFAAGSLYLGVSYTRDLIAARAAVQELNAGLEMRVTERTAALTRANEEIQRFAYIVSHDLRAPLVNIMGFTSELEVGMQTLRDYLSADPPDDTLTRTALLAANEDIPESVRFIRASTSKMDGLINAILRLSREGRRELYAERIDLTQLLNNAATSLKHQLDQAQATVQIEANVPVIVSDRLALEQVFGNLLDNAVKYLVTGREGRIAVKAVDEGSRIVVRVEDNGRGIAEQDVERIFELFRRAGVQDKVGEGIGLAHVRALVRRLGGDVTVESRLGVGSTFLVELPKLLPQQARVAS
jgi:signal transduction histidine kinase